MYVKQKQAELYKEKIYSQVVQKQESRQMHIKNDKEHVMFQAYLGKKKTENRR